MKRDQIHELHYITPLVNLPSILERGILSHDRAERLQHQSIAMIEVQGTRSGVTLPNGHRLHSYANLYFNGRNAMMSKRKALHAEVGVISVDCRVLDLDGVIVTDCNAASIGYAEFGTPEEMLRKLDRDEIFARSWNHDDYYQKRRHRARMCAEVLVPDVVLPELIRGVHVSCEEAGRQVSELGVRSVLNPYFFFRGEPL
jgi:hypothetical protein